MVSAEPGLLFQFDDYALDVGCRELKRGAQFPFPLPGQQS
jgi:hypothetical protein